MRFIHILCHYMKGIRLLAFVLFLLMLWGIICGVSAFGKVQNIRNDLDIIASADAENAYLLSYFFHTEQQSEKNRIETTVNTLKANPAVDQVLSIRVANPVSYAGTRISIVLYEPALLNFFPALKNYGIDFEHCQNGCILGSQIFGSLDEGDEICLSFSNKEISFPVAGRIQNPYRRLTLSVSSSAPLCEDLFREGDTIIMQSTPAVLATLEPLVKRIELDSNLIVVFKDNTTPEEQKAVLSADASAYQHAHFLDIISRTKQQVSQTLKKELPQPIALAVMAFASYFSILILVFRKKSKQLSVLYLCGCSQYKCGLIAFAASQVVLLFPVLGGALFVLIWPQIDWSLLGPKWFGLRTFVETITINTSCLWVVAWYYLITTLCAVAVTSVTISKHTPATYLRRES